MVIDGKKNMSKTICNDDYMADIREDGSEILHYDNPEFQIFCRFNYIPANEILLGTTLHWHEDLEFIYIYEGEITQHINGRAVVLHAGEGIFINARQVHEIKSRDVDCRLYCLIFKPTMLCSCNFVEERFVTPIIENDSVPYLILSDEDDRQRKVLSLVKEIIDISRDDDNTILMVKDLFEMWNVLFTIADIKNDKPRRDVGLSAIKEMITYIQREYARHIDMKDICNAGAVGKTKCSELFKKYVHMPPVEYLICYRLEMASRLLENTDMSITDIAYETGFTGASYFAEAFRKRVNCTPLEYRRGKRNEHKGS